MKDNHKEKHTQKKYKRPWENLNRISQTILKDYLKIKNHLKNQKNLERLFSLVTYPLKSAIGQMKDVSN